MDRVFHDALVNFYDRIRKYFEYDSSEIQFLIQFFKDRVTERDILLGNRNSLKYIATPLTIIATATIDYCICAVLLVSSLIVVKSLILWSFDIMFPEDSHKVITERARLKNISLIEDCFKDCLITGLEGVESEEEALRIYRECQKTCFG
jgi:hypothetical protein